MAKKFRFFILIVILTAAGVLFVQRSLNVPEVDLASVIRISGNIEVTDTEVSFKIPGRVIERRVDEGELVRKGQPIARLENTDLEREVDLRKGELKEAESVLYELLAGSRPEEIRQARATVERAQAQLDKLLAGSRSQEIATARAAMERAHSEMENSRIEYERQKKLVKEGVVSTEAFEQAETLHEVARARFRESAEQLKLIEEGPRKEEVESARATLAEATERYRLVKKGPRKETIDQARARVEMAKAALALSRIRLGYAQVVAPMSGVVISKNIEPGEYVSPGTPVVTLADLDNVWVRGYINETDLGRVKLGQRARIAVDTFPGKSYEGKVTFIASMAEFTPKNVQTKKERVKLVYRVKVSIRNPHRELKPGMPADCEILMNAGSEPWTPSG